MKRLALIMAAVALVLAAATPAYGQGAVVDAYGGKPGDVLGAVDDGRDGQAVAGVTQGGGGPAAPAPQAAAAAQDSGTLPFTGLDLGLLALGGVLLLGIGIGLRRFAKPLS